MTEGEYLEVQTQLILQAQLIADLDLDGFLDMIGHAEAVAPILDPTLYIRGAEKLENVKRLAQAAQKFQAEVHRQLGRAK